MATSSSMILWPLNVVLRPDRLISERGDHARSGLIRRSIEMMHLLVFLFANVMLYALPLTLAGVGVNRDGSTDPVVTALIGSLPADAGVGVVYLTALITNSGFLLVAALLTLLTFHAGIILSGSSRGLVVSFHAVAYSTGIYLAFIFTLVVYASTATAVSLADDLLLWLQGEFIYSFIDHFDAGLSLPGGRPAPVDAAALTGLDRAIIVGLLVFVAYYLYVLYAGARIGHGASRVQAAISTLFVLLSPVLYVIAIINASLYF